MGEKGGEIMDRSKKYAIEAAKEITVAVMSEGNLRVDKAGGESVGDFFQAVYSKIEEIAKDVTGLGNQ